MKTVSLEYPAAGNATRSGIGQFQKHRISYTLLCCRLPWAIICVASILSSKINHNNKINHIDSKLHLTLEVILANLDQHNVTHI